MSPGLPFRQHLGDPAKLRKTLVAWLRQNQETWAPVFNQWEGIGPGRLQGVARVVSICRVKARVTRLATTLEVPVRGWGGLALHWVDARDYTAALINRQGVLRIDRRKGGRWQQLYIGQGPKPINGRLSLVATRTKEGVYLTVGQGRHGPFELPGSHFGLALDRARVRFRKTSWK